MTPARHPVSRRTALLAVTAGGAAAALAACGRDRDTPAPTAAPPTATPPAFPLPVRVARDASPEFRAVADALVDAMRRHRIPGAALGILTGRREEHATFGVASLSSLRPVTPDTVFQIGSITKIYTATAIWRLVEQGTLSPDGLVRRYLRGLRLRDEETAARVTVNNLLSHTAGWYGDDIVDTGDDPDALGRYVDTRLPEAPQLFECGKFFSYNNSGCMVLGRLIETIANTDYNDALQRLVLGPLGLGGTVLDHGTVLRRPYADGHIAMPINGRDAVAVATPVWLPRCVDPAGGIWSTTREVLRFVRLHLGEQPAGQPPFLSPTSLRAMQDPVVDVPGLDLKMGRNWFVQDVDGVRVILHDGDTPGQHAVLVAIPERRFAVVLLLNGQSGAEAGLAALDAALGRYPGLSALAGKVGLVRALLAPADAPDFTVPRGELSAYAGSYADPGKVTTLRVSGSGLESTAELTPPPGSWQPALSPPPAPGPTPVTFLAPDSAAAGGMRLPFVRDGEGAVGWIGEGLRLRPRT